MIDTGYFLEERPKHRRTVIRQALLYTPGAVVAVVLLAISVWSIIQGSYGALIAAVILALVSLALVTQSIAAVRDLFAQPVTTTGMVRRAWTKGFLLGLVRSHYLLVGRGVFDVGVVIYSQTQDGDRLEIRHWPHSKTVISVRKLPAERDPALEGSRRRGPEDPDSSSGPA
jgi:hypothetical protein